MAKENSFDRSLKLIAKSSFIVLISIFISKIFTYAYRVIIARQFGPETYGLFSLALIFAGWVLVIASLGLGEGILRFVPRYEAKGERNKSRYLFRKSSYMLLITGFLGGILLFFSASFISNNIFHNTNLIPFLRFFSISIPLSVFLSFFLAFLRAHEEIVWHSFINNILINFVHVVLIVVFILLGLGVNSIIYSYLFGLLSAVLLAFFILKIKMPYLFKSETSKKEIRIFKEVIVYSWPLLLSGIVWRLFSQIDSFMIGIFKSIGDVGVYNAVIPIVFSLQIFSQMFMQLFFPLVNKEYSKKNIKLVKNLSQQIGKWIFMINFPLVILLWIFPGAFINILFGADYLAGENALRILSLGVLVISIFVISNRLIAMAGNSKILFRDIFLISVINLLLNWPLIKLYGLIGAAIATTISFIILSILFGFRSYKLLKIVPLRRKMVNIAFAGIISAAALSYLKLFIETETIIPLTILGSFFLILYILLLFLLGAFDKTDFMIAKSFIKKLKIIK
jgi:O-antigen/teichoic acid export membrane protein